MKSGDDAKSRCIHNRHTKCKTQLEAFVEGPERSRPWPRGRLQSFNLKVAKIKLITNEPGQVVLL